MFSMENQIPHYTIHVGTQASVTYPSALTFSFYEEGKEEQNTAFKIAPKKFRLPAMALSSKLEDWLDTGAQCTLIPSRHGDRIRFYCWRGRGSQDLTLVEAEMNLTGKEWKKHPVVTSPEFPCILGIDLL